MKHRYSSIKLQPRLSNNKFNLILAKMGAREAGILQPGSAGPAPRAYDGAENKSIETRATTTSGLMWDMRGDQALRPQEKDWKGIKETTRSIERVGTVPLKLVSDKIKSIEDVLHKGPRNRAKWSQNVHPGAKRAAAIMTNQLRPVRIESEFASQFQAKQALKHYYGSLKTKITKIEKLELRLDVIVFRLKMARSIYEARQLISHGHIVVSGSVFYDPKALAPHPASRAEGGALPAPLCEIGSSRIEYTIKNPGYIVPIGSIIKNTSTLAASSKLSHLSWVKPQNTMSCHLISINYKEGLLIRAPELWEICLPLRTFNLNKALLAL